MNVDVVYSYLMNSGLVFLGGWTLMLVTAAVLVFRQDDSKPYAPRGAGRQGN